MVDFLADARCDCSEHHVLVRSADLYGPHLRAYRERYWARCGTHLRIPVAGQQERTSAETTSFLVAQLAVVHCTVLPAALQRKFLPQLAERPGVQLEFRAAAAVGGPPAACGLPSPYPLQARAGRQPGSPAPHCRQVRRTARDHRDRRLVFALQLPARNPIGWMICSACTAIRRILLLEIQSELIVQMILLPARDEASPCDYQKV
mmetsp:Transcript_16559/g.43779  ORF Transcript_16559/g.43779 Transcript_16559/m.43779 type:complete len:205 (-) Transcript_16559:108-722(-)